MSVWVLVIVGTIALSVSTWVFSSRSRSGYDAGTAKLSEGALIQNVRLAIKPEFPNWVLFSNGTYVIIDGEIATSDPRAYALEQMREFGPVHTGCPAGDFSVTTLQKTEGWSVGGHGIGMYTYVHPSELKKWRRSLVRIGVHGRRKRDVDSKELRIVYVSGST